MSKDFSAGGQDEEIKEGIPQLAAISQPPSTVSKNVYKELKKQNKKPKAAPAKSGGILGFLGLGGKKKEAAKPESESNSDSDLDEEQYLQRNLSCESLDSDDLSGELNLSDCEDAA